MRLHRPRARVLQKLESEKAETLAAMKKESEQLAAAQ